RDANGNLLRSKVRSLLTIVAIFIGAMTLTITNGIGSGVSEYIDKQLGNLGAEDVLIVQPEMEDPFESGPKKYEEGSVASSMYGGLGPTMQLLQDKDIKEITSVEGIVSASPYLGASPDYVIGPNSEKYQLTVSPYIEGTNLELIGGKLPDNGSADKELILPFDYVSVLGFKNPDDAVEKEVKIAITSAAGESRM